MKHSIWILIFALLLFTTSSSAEEKNASAAYQTFPAIFEATQKAVLSAERPGQLSSLKFDVGSTVKKGEIVAAVDTGELELRKKRAEQALRHLEVQVKDLSGLKEKGLSTNEEVAKSQMERDVTRTDVDIIKGQIAQSYVRAPFSCAVVRRHVSAFEWVTAGQPIMDVVNLDEIRAVANIPSHFAVALSQGVIHTFYVNDLNAEVKGTVFAVAPEVDERSNTVQVIWKINREGQKLWPGMKGEVRIEQ
jgi:RND family efflux transporter MFP subunit